MLHSEIYANMSTPSRKDSQDSKEQDNKDTDTSYDDTMFTNSPTASQEKRGRGRPKKSISATQAASAARSQSLDRSSKKGRKVRSRADSSSCITCMKAIDEEEYMICQLCQGYSCLDCSKIPLDLITFMKSQCWICRHCQNSGLPTLKKINDTLSEFQESTNKKFSKLENKTLRDMKVTNETQFAKLEKKITDLEVAVDVKIDRKFDEKKEDMKKEIAESIEESMANKIQDEVDRVVEEKLKSYKHPEIESLEQNIMKIVEEKLKAIKHPDNKTLENKIAKEVEKRLKSHTTKNLEALETKLQKNQTDEIKKIVQELTQDTVPSSTTSSSNSSSSQVSPRTTVKNVTSEMREKEKRLKNIIIHGIPDPKAQDKESRDTEDKKKFLQIIDERLGITATLADIRDSHRLGKNDQRKDPSRPLPLLITVKDLALKDDLFKNTHKLKGTRDLSFGHDLTPLERDEHKKLLDEARELAKNDLTGAQYRVRGPPWDKRIVKLTTQEEIVGGRLEKVQEEQEKTTEKAQE